MTLLDLQGMDAPCGWGCYPPAGSGLTILGCGSQTPSCLSAALCH